MAADGNGNNLSTTRVFTAASGGPWGTHLKSVMGYPYLPRMNGAVVEVSEAGACDPNMKNLLARLSPGRFATVFFRAVRNAVTGDLVISPGVYQVFNLGTGEGGLTGADTNAVEQGGLVPAGTRWYSIAAKVAWQAPFQVATGQLATGDRVYPVNLSGELSYGRRMARALADQTYAEINHGTGNACKYAIGPLGLWNDGVGDGSEAFNMNGGVAGTFMWFSTPDESTGKNEDGALRMTVEVTRSLTLEQDAFNPTTAGQDVILPMKITLMGFPLCEPRYCAPGAPLNMETFLNMLGRAMQDPNMRQKILQMGAGG